MKMQMSELMISSPHNFPCILYITFWKFPLLFCSNMSRYLYQSKHYSAFIQSGYKASLLSHKIGIFVISVNKMHGRWWHHQLNHLHIHIDCSTNVSMKITEIQNFISSLFCIRLHQIFSILFEMFYCFYWLDLNLDWISPLRIKDIAWYW